MGILGGHESQRRDQTPARYHQAAKADAQRACIGADRAVLFECIYDKVEASAEQAHDEQDLSAQQRAASAALVAAIASLLGIGVSIVGIHYIRRTIAQGQEALDHARKVSRDDLRPWLTVSLKAISGIQPEPNEKGAFNIFCEVTLANIGKTPALDPDIRMVAHSTNDPEIWANIRRVIAETRARQERSKRHIGYDVMPEGSVPTNIFANVGTEVVAREGALILQVCVVYRSSEHSDYHHTSQCFGIGSGRTRIDERGREVPEFDLLGMGGEAR